MKKIIKTATLLSMIVFALSCAKEKDDEDTTPTPTDTVNPELTFLNTFSAMYSPGTKVVIKFKATDDKQLKSAKITVTNTTIDSVYLTKNYTATGLEFTATDSVVTNLTTTMADFVVEIQAEDNSGNTATKTKGFHVM